MVGRFVQSLELKHGTTNGESLHPVEHARKGGLEL